MGHLARMQTLPFSWFYIVLKTAIKSCINLYWGKGVTRPFEESGFLSLTLEHLKCLNETFFDLCTDTYTHLPTTNNMSSI